MQLIKEGYAFFTLYLSKILWVTYLVWAFVFDDFLNLLYFPFPSKYWAAIIPSATIFTFLCFILFTIIYSFVKTEPPSSIHLVEDEYSCFKDKITGRSMDNMNDIKIEQINKLFYETSLYFE
ncbi:phosphatidylinositol N-acetylglucosaminyltransferase subunit P, putative [Plasmodium malariae]|uniref:Phosphatidylinositol N-acetylglucosaminyltransferase subunit P, putative n=1 Tax=Plasmodium malariae TaxID=5858 RepID=A0A1D3JMX4_PLAMA|nr:phosphatidylinositol N-acetylglucosaminyltransferase subunit P, putative [Plasmodium malariae]SBT88008.1 phosphatidylinositol N-acetylglucosaminyltransferase subunit P, putative [Plasmodium malariae]